MQADEYDLLISDPSNFFTRSYLPRVFGSLAPWSMLGAITDVIELPFTGGYMIPMGIPPVAAGLPKTARGGPRGAEVGARQRVAIDGYSIATLGLPPFIAAPARRHSTPWATPCAAPRGIMLDKFRQPKKVLAAMERLAPIAIESGVRQATGNHGPFVFIPLHKGADGFMSDKDSRRSTGRR